MNSAYMEALKKIDLLKSIISRLQKENDTMYAAISEAANLGSNAALRCRVEIQRIASKEARDIIEHEATDNDVHVYPLNDLHRHIIKGPACTCGPQVMSYEGRLVYIHNAWNSREDVELKLVVMYGENE